MKETLLALSRLASLAARFIAEEQEQGDPDLTAVEICKALDQLASGLERWAEEKA